MALNWDFVTSLLSAGAGAAGTMMGGPVGGLIGALGTGGIQGLGKGFGLTDTASGIPGLVDETTGKGLQDMAAAQLGASFTGSGMEGAYANREAFMKSRELSGTQSAESMIQQQIQRGLGRQALSAAQQQTDLARAAADRTLGAQSRGFMEQAAAAGASPAALAAGMSNLGASNINTLAGLQQQGMQAQQQGLQQAGQAFAAAEQARLADQAAREQQFQKFQLQKFAGSGAGQLGALIGAQSAAAQTSQQISAAEDPLALLKATGGQFAAQGINNLTIEQLIKRAKELGLNLSTAPTGTT
jgi:hypothetical protein